MIHLPPSDRKHLVEQLASFLFRHDFPRHDWLNAPKAHKKRYRWLGYMMYAITKHGLEDHSRDACHAEMAFQKLPDMPHDAHNAGGF